MQSKNQQENSTFAAESGHFYWPDGRPAYTVENKSKPGTERNTTVKDAKKLGLLPSVTTILKVADKPALNKWMRNQVLLSALTLPRKEGEFEADWLVRVEHDWQEQGRAAADKGTSIHGAIERFYKADGSPIDSWLTPYVKYAMDELLLACGNQQWKPERSFACETGYGGKIDLHSDEWIIDVKTKDGDLADVDVYDEHITQLSAYRRGLNIPDARCGILFVRRDLPEAKFVEIASDDLERGLVMFNHLLGYWKAKNKVSA